MKAILIPVKEFREAKKRLAPHLSVADRAGLAQAMCMDFFEVVAAVDCVDSVFVASKEAFALDQAQRHGWGIIPERQQVSESDSVDAAARECAAKGVQALLRLPIDLPLAEPRDIVAIFQKLCVTPSAVLVPSRDGTGTNALLRTPPTLFPSRFGPGSFALHFIEAERCGANVVVLHNPRLEVDIDELEDLRRAIPRLREGSATARWCSEQDLDHLEMRDAWK